MLKAFVSATLAKDCCLARTHTANSINKEIKNMWSRYMETYRKRRPTGMSTSQR